MLGTSLKGLKVVDFTQVAAGPASTQTLADLGASVVKVESRQGELCRALAPFVQGQSVGFMALNAGKQSVVLDLKDAAQAEAALRLAAQADIVVESFRPGVMARLGLGYEDVARRRPDTIYCSVSAYGQQGPWKDKPGVDGVLQAVSGLMSVTGMADAPPCKVQVPIVDMVTGYLASVAIVAAVARREREGGGEWIDMSMFASAVALQQMALATYMADDVVPSRLGSAAPYAAPNEALRCSDGWIMVAAYHPQRWSALCAVLAAPELETDPRFRDLSGRIAHRGALVALLEARMASATKAHWLARFEAADIICAPINDYADVVSSVPFVSGAMTEAVRHPVAGDLMLTRTPLRSMGELPTPRSPAPLVGEHTREVLLHAGVPQDLVDDWLAPSRPASTNKEMSACP